jgi:[ribosomal protein S18]-alanine N-acetyltransferase
MRRIPAGDTLMSQEMITMKFTFSLMDEADARSVCAWRYEAPYDVYNMGDDGEEKSAITELLDRRSPYYAVRDDTLSGGHTLSGGQVIIISALVGFFCYGTASLPWSSGEPSLYVDNKIMVIGLGIRPDLTGKGSGLSFVNAGLAYAREQFAPSAFRLYVLSFNQRAMRVYERAGFHVEETLTVHNIHGTLEFVEMACEVQVVNT